MAPDSHVTDTGFWKLGAMERLKFLAETVVPLCAAVLGVMRYAMGPHVPWFVYAAIAAAVAVLVSGVRGCSGTGGTRGWSSC